FFIKINTLVSIIIGLIVLIYVVFDRKFVLDYIKSLIKDLKKVNPILIIVFLIFFYIILKFSYNAMITYDTWLYHDQSVKWNEEYKIVPGLGNVHSRLGFSSTYFLTNSFFENNITYVFSSFSYIILLLIVFYGLNNILNKNLNLTNILASGSLIFLIHSIGDLPSLSNEIGRASCRERV